MFTLGDRCGGQSQRSVVRLRQSHLVNKALSLRATHLHIGSQSPYIKHSGVSRVSEIHGRKCRFIFSEKAAALMSARIESPLKNSEYQEVEFYTESGHQKKVDFIKT